MNSTCVETFEFNLDADPRTRWNHILCKYLEPIHWINDHFDELVPVPATRLAVKTLEKLVKSGNVMHHEEIMGIAEYTNVPVGRVALLQLLYESAACCTSIIYRTPRGNCMVRSMDWDLPALKRMTINIRVMSKGKELFTATTWAGYIGVLTAIRKGSFGVSVNLRSRKGHNAFGNVPALWKRYWPIGLLVREVMITCTSYRTAVDAFCQAKIAAPTYVSVCGITEGCVITRNHEEEEHRAELNLYLIQTNADSWLSEHEIKENNVLLSWERAQHASKFLNNLPQCPTEQQMWDLFQQYPIMNEESIYATFMHPFTGELRTKIYK